MFGGEKSIGESRSGLGEEIRGKRYAEKGQPERDPN